MEGLLWREEGGEGREEEGSLVHKPPPFLFGVGSGYETRRKGEGVRREQREKEVLQWLIPHPTGLRASVEGSQRTWLQGGPVVTCPATPPRCQPASLEGEETEGLLLP